MPQLEPIDFKDLKEKSPEKWRHGRELSVEKYSKGSYGVEDSGSEYLVRLVRRGPTWYGWCECDGFDALETCVHVCSAAMSEGSMEGIGGD